MTIVLTPDRTINIPLWSNDDSIGLEFLCDYPKQDYCDNLVVHFKSLILKDKKLCFSIKEPQGKFGDLSIINYEDLNAILVYLYDENNKVVYYSDQVEIKDKILEHAWEELLNYLNGGNYELKIAIRLESQGDLIFIEDYNKHNYLKI